MILQKTYRPHPIRNINLQDRVDIICPFFGQYEKVTRLLESIIRFTRGIPYQICLVDDCSPNTGYLDFLSTIPGLMCVRSPSQLGFAGAMHLGFQKTESPLCVFMHSDCLVEDMGWLKSLLQSLIRGQRQNIGMVSPMTNNVVSGDLRQKGDKNKTEQALDIVLDLDKDPEAYLSMHCFAVSRDLFRHVGGFIKNYPYGWYEDMEFAHRMNKYGYKQAIASNAWIHHEGSNTVKDVWRRNQDIKKIMEEDNHSRCQNDLKELYQKRND